MLADGARGIMKLFYSESGPRYNLDVVVDTPPSLPASYMIHDTTALPPHASLIVQWTNNYV